MDTRLPVSTGNKGAGGGGGAPTDAEFVVLGLDSHLTAERVLTGASGVIQLTDGGPNSTLTVDVAAQGIDFSRVQNVSSGELLGRSSAGAGSIEEISLGAGLSLVSGTLSATGGGSGAPLARMEALFSAPSLPSSPRVVRR